VPEHLLCDVEVRDDAVLQRPDGLDRAGRAAEHALGLDAHRMYLTSARINRNYARLGEHDAAAADVHERVRSAEVDRHVAATKAGEVAKEAHWRERVRRALRRALSWGGHRRPRSASVSDTSPTPSRSEPGKCAANRTWGQTPSGG